MVKIDKPLFLQKEARVVFLGTPDFAVPSLQMLIDKGYQIVGVFTQKDKPVGRKQTLQAPPVKIFAEMHHIPVFQVNKIRLPEGQALLKALCPDIMITAAFGQILSQENLDTPKLGCINVHGSLLPKYRGAAPIQQAIIDGETETGITTMLTEIGIDSGDILLQKRVAILQEDTSESLFSKMAILGAETLQETLEMLFSGELTQTPQDDALATFCRMLKKDSGQIDWNGSAQSIHDLIRGVNPWPGAFTTNAGEIIKIWSSRVIETESQNSRNGEILVADAKHGLQVTTKKGTIEILELQMPGAKRMNAKDYLRGRSLAVGSLLE